MYSVVLLRHSTLYWQCVNWLALILFFVALDSDMEGLALGTLGTAEDLDSENSATDGVDYVSNNW